MNDVRRKIDLYILSLALLFVFFLILLIKIPDFLFNYKDSMAWRSLVLSNLLPIGSIFALSYCVFAYMRFKFDLKGATDIPFEIKKIDNIEEYISQVQAII